MTTDERYNVLLKAAEDLSTMIHGLEARGIDLTKREDDVWYRFTIVVQTEYDRRKKCAKRE